MFFNKSLAQLSQVLLFLNFIKFDLNESHNLSFLNNSITKSTNSLLFFATNPVLL